VIHLWEHPLPSSVAEADALLSQLRAQRTGQNPKFERLAKALTNRFPCLADDDGDGEGSVSSDGPPDGHCSSAVLALGVGSGALGMALPVIVQEAASRGLVVYDIQLGRSPCPTAASSRCPVTRRWRCGRRPQLPTN